MDEDTCRFLCAEYGSSCAPFFLVVGGGENIDAVEVTDALLDADPDPDPDPEPDPVDPDGEPDPDPDGADAEPAEDHETEGAEPEPKAG